MPEKTTSAIKGTAGQVARGAGAGAALAVGEGMFGNILGNAMGAVVAGLVMPDSRDMVAFIAGMRIADGLFRGTPTGGGVVI